MFSRIREATLILAYREPESGEDAVIVEHKPASFPAAGKVISQVIEVFALVYSLAFVAGRVGEHLNKLIPPMRSVSTETLAGAVGVLLVMTLHSVRDDIEKKIRARINLSELLAPYFGHRIDNTLRTLKG